MDASGVAGVGACAGYAAGADGVGAPKSSKSTAGAGDAGLGGLCRREDVPVRLRSPLAPLSADPDELLLRGGPLDFRASMRCLAASDGATVVRVLLVGWDAEDGWDVDAVVGGSANPAGS